MTAAVIPGTTFAGYEMAQTWEDLQLYERVFNDRPDLKCVIELGTGQGGLSQFFRMQAEVRQFAFYTFDYMEGSKPVPGWIQMDVLQNSVEVQKYFQHPMLLLCDNGDKPREVRTYAPLMKVGDLVAVHDWDDEIYQSDIPGALMMMWPEHSKSMTRIFEVIA